MSPPPQSPPPKSPPPMPPPQSPPPQSPPPRVAAPVVAAPVGTVVVDVDVGVVAAAPAPAAAQHLAQEQACHQPPAAAEPAAAVERRSATHIGGLALLVEVDRRLAPAAGTAEVGGRGRRFPALGDRLGPGHGVLGLVEEASDPDQVDGLVGGAQRLLRHPVPRHRRLVVGAGVGMEVDQRPEVDHVVGQHGQLGLEDVAVALVVCPRPRLLAPEVPQPAAGSPGQEEHGEHARSPSPAAFVARGCVASALVEGRARPRPGRLDGRLGAPGGLGPAHPLDEVLQDRLDTVVTVGLEGGRGQRSPLSGSQAVASPPEAPARHHPVGPGQAGAGGQRRGQAAGVAPALVDGGRGQDGHEDGRVRGLDALAQAVLVDVARHIRLRVHVDGLRPEAGRGLVEDGRLGDRGAGEERGQGDEEDGGGGEAAHDRRSTRRGPPAPQFQ